MNVKLGVRFLIVGVAAFLSAMLFNQIANGGYGDVPDALTLGIIFCAAAGVLSILAGLLCMVVAAWQWTARRS